MAIRKGMDQERKQSARQGFLVRGLVKMQILTRQAWQFAFPASFQVLPLLLAQGPHYEEQKAS